MKTNQIAPLPAGENQSIATINGVALQIVSEDLAEYVPLKPICEILGVNYAAQINKVKSDEILSSTVLLSNTVGADGKDREMICLPIQYVFGWLFTLKNICKVKNFVYVCSAKVYESSRELRLMLKIIGLFFMPLHNGGCLSLTFLLSGEIVDFSEWDVAAAFSKNQSCLKC